MKKVLQKIPIEGIYNKPIDNILLNGEKLKACPLKLWTNQEYPLPAFPFITVLEVFSRAIQVKKIKGTQIEKRPRDSDLQMIRILYIDALQKLPGISTAKKDIQQSWKKQNEPPNE